MKVQITIEWDSETPDVTQVSAQLPEQMAENPTIIPVILARAIEATLVGTMQQIGAPH